jgi:CO dehydrogenase maturation factor
VGRTHLIVNRLPDEMPAPMAEAIEKTGLTLIGTVPNDAAMTEFEFSGQPLVELPADTAVYKAIQEIAQKIL